MIALAALSCARAQTAGSFTTLSLSGVETSSNTTAATSSSAGALVINNNISLGGDGGAYFNGFINLGALGGSGIYFNSPNVTSPGRIAMTPGGLITIIAGGNSSSPNFIANANPAPTDNLLAITKISWPSYSSANLGATGTALSVWSDTFTDSSTAAGTTTPETVFSSFAAPTLAASNSGVTTQNAATVYIQGAPIAGTNQTILGSWGLWNAGNSFLQGNVQIGANAYYPDNNTVLLNVDPFDVTTDLTQNNNGSITARFNTYDITDTGSSGTYPSLVLYNFLSNGTVSATHQVHYNDVAVVGIGTDSQGNNQAPPAPGTNVTMGGRWGLWNTLPTRLDGNIQINAPTTTFSSSTAATSASTGALVINNAISLGGDGSFWSTGNANIAGNLTVGGTITSNTSGGALSLDASGTNQNVTLSPTGTGAVVANGNLSVSGTETLSSSTAATSSSAGALVINNNIALGGDGSAYFNGWLNVGYQGSNSGINFNAPGLSSPATIEMASNGQLKIVPGGSSGNAIVMTAAPSYNYVTTRLTSVTDINWPSYSQSNLGTQGSVFNVQTGTFTDSSTTAGTTTPEAVFSAFSAPTLAAANSGVTTQNAATVYIQGAPTAGTNQTISNSWGLWNAGNTRLDGTLVMTNPTAATSTSTGALVINNNLGLGGDGSIWAAGNANIAGNLTVSGTFTAPNFSGNGLTGNGTSGLTFNAGGTNESIILNPSGSGVAQVNGNAKVTSTTASTSTTTGSLVNAGGFGNAGSAYIGGSINGGGNLAIAGNNAVIGSASASSGVGLAVNSLLTTSTAYGEQIAYTYGPNPPGPNFINDLYLQLTISPNSPVSSWNGLNIGNPTLSSGSTLQTAIGLNIANITSGAATNYAIKTGTGWDTFGGPVSIGNGSGPQPQVQLTIDGVAPSVEGSAYAATIQSAFDANTKYADTFMIAPQFVTGSSATFITDLHIANPSVAGSTVVTATGIGIDPITAGSGQNFALLTHAGLVTFGDTTASTSPTTGSLTNAGGFGNAGSAYIGGNLSVSGTGTNSFTGAVTVGSSAASTSTGTGALVINNNLGLGGDGSIWAGGAVNVRSTTASSSTSNGALVVAGGAGVGGQLTAGSAVVNGTTNVGGALTVTGQSNLNGPTSMAAAAVAGTAALDGGAVVENGLQVATGNVGVGISSPALGSLQVGPAGILSNGVALGRTDANTTYFGSNFKFANNGWEFINGSQDAFQMAFNGTAGTTWDLNVANGTGKSANYPISWIQAMSIGSSGNISVGGGIPGYGTLTPSYFGVVGNATASGVAQLELAPPSGGVSTTSLVSKLRFRATFDDYATDQDARVAAQLVGGYDGGVWGNEYLAFQVGGSNDGGADPVEKMRITADGNVGIGQKDPQSSLDVNGGATIGASYSGNYAAPANGLLVQGNVGVGTNTPHTALDIAGTVRATTQTVPTAGAGTEMAYANGQGWIAAYDRTNNVWNGMNLNGSTLTLNSYGGGNVGIGSTSPGFKLTISAGDVAIDNGQTYRSGGDALISRSTSNVLTVGAATTSDQLVLMAGESERARITAAGNFGIGTSDPQFNLDINGTANVSGALTVHGPTTISNSFTVVGSETVTGNISIAGTASANSGSFSGSSGTLSVSGQSSFAGLATFGNGVMINGAGVTSLTGLTVGMQGNAAPALVFSSTGISATADITRGSVKLNSTGLEATSGNLVLSADTPGQNIVFDAPSGTENMRITSTGQVGIWTKNPDAPLTVRGEIHASEVLVDTGVVASSIRVLPKAWADDVLETGHTLAPLSQVEGEIRSERHLPGVPSAQEVAEKGVDVGQMQAVLLGKVEELTLRMIEQEKRIERLEKENAELKAAR